MHVDPFVYLSGLEQFGIKLGLDNIRTILDRLGRPQDAFRSIHIGGTNGKGSVTAMVDSVLRAAGLRTGRYTSPHLVHLTERFAVDGRDIEEAVLRDAVTQVVETVLQLRDEGTLEVHPTFFEVTTAAAFVLFRQHQVEVAVCEVGLGGRLDSTNVLSPVATAITSIGLDHQQYLGPTISDIAAEKAGIIKPAVPVVLGEVNAEADAVISALARERGAPLVRADEGVDCDVDPAASDSSPQIHLRTPTRRYGPLSLGLPGEHQVRNAIVAIRLLETLHLPNHPIDEAAISRGLAQVVWPGRLQHLAVTDQRGVLLDAAHNVDGASALARHLRGQAPRPLVFAAMRDKDIDGIVRALVGSVSAVIVTRASHPRSATSSELMAAVRRVATDTPCIAAESPAEALQAAWQLSSEIVVAGSIFLLGDVMRALKPS